MVNVMKNCKYCKSNISDGNLKGCPNCGLKLCNDCAEKSKNICPKCYHNLEYMG